MTITPVCLLREHLLLLTTTARLPPLVIRFLSALTRISQEQIGVQEKPRHYYPEVVELAVKTFQCCCF